MKILAGINELNFSLLNSNQIERHSELLKEYDLSIYEYKIKETYEYLEPWIQWPTVYSGKTAKEHKGFFLGDINSELDCIWSRGKGWFIFSPMNMRKPEDFEGVFIEDPWLGRETSSYPFKSIFSIIRSNEKLIDLKNILRFLSLIPILLIPSFKFLFSKNIKDILVSPRIFLALFLDYAVSLYILKKSKKLGLNKVHFFLNGAAHVQHRFGINERTSKAILYFLVKSYNLYKNYSKEFIVVTGLTQENYKKETYYWKLKDFSFFHEIGIKDINFTRRMSKDLTTSFNPDLLRVLDKITISGSNLFQYEVKDNKIYLETSFYDANPAEIEFNSINIGLIDQWFKRIAKKEAHHVPYGFILSQADNKIENIEDIRSNLLDNFFET
tara:strand:+ start:3312 stop:4463 length:1152 start_codon:yes stop_codon:yes gene_type:complete